MRLYLDADILIWHLRGKRRAFSFISELHQRPEFELWIGAMQRAEILFFLRSGEEEKTELLLSLFQTAPLDQNIIDQGARLYRRWHPSHGVDIHDALLAATVQHSGGKLYTLNRKHYPMPDLLVERAWSEPRLPS